MTRPHSPRTPSLPHHARAPAAQAHNIGGHAESTLRSNCDLAR